MRSSTVVHGSRWPQNHCSLQDSIVNIASAIDSILDPQPYWKTDDARSTEGKNLC